MQLRRLQGRKVCDFVLRRGLVWKGTFLTARILAGSPKNQTGHGVYLGTFASAKLHKSAVVRNRMRRRVREALRLGMVHHPEQVTVQLLVSPKTASLDAPFALIQEEVERLLQHLSS